MEGRSRSARDSLRRRQLEASRLRPLASNRLPTATALVASAAPRTRPGGLGGKHPRARIAHGSAAYPVVDHGTGRAVQDSVPALEPAMRRDEDRTMIVTPRVWDSSASPAFAPERPPPGSWLLPVLLATGVAVGLVILALLIR